MRETITFLRQPAQLPSPAHLPNQYKMREIINFLRGLGSVIHLAGAEYLLFHSFYSPGPNSAIMAPPNVIFTRVLKGCGIPRSARHIALSGCWPRHVAENARTPNHYKMREIITFLCQPAKLPSSARQPAQLASQAAGPGPLSAIMAPPNVISTRILKGCGTPAPRDTVP